jgi:molecular chaperone DnaK
MAELFSGSEKDLERCFTKARDEVLSSYSPVFGIDFGTTNSVVAIFNKKSKKVEIILTSRGSEFEPSFFGVDKNNRPVFGDAARLRSLIASDCVVARVKRSLGERKLFSVGGKKYRSEEVVAKILQWLRLNAEAHLKSKVEAMFYNHLESNNLKIPEVLLNEFLNKQNGYNHLEDVVLSVPAYFNDNQKRATRDSAEIAGLRVRRLLHEPTAAALAYCYQKTYSGKLAVIDLGGGTLDISILDVGEGVYDVQTVGGDTKLGGSDIDAELVRHVVKDIKKTLGIDISQNTHPNEIARLRDACENLKINLSSLNEYTMELVHFLNRPRYTFTMKRTELEDLSRPILERIKTTIEKTIKEDGSDVNRFLLVGNATKMPEVRYLAEKTIRARHLTGIDSGTVVATGIALEGAILSGDLTQTLLLDIIPYSLGIAALIDPKIAKKNISRLLERNLTIPTKKSDTYTTAKDNQPNVHIEIYQGESMEPHKNYFLGDFILEGIALSPAGTPKIEVTFEIDVDCILTVTAVDKGTGNKQSMRIEGAVTLSPKEKQNLSRHFTESEKQYSLEKDHEKLRFEIEGLESACDKAIEDAERSIKDFFELFHEKVEVNARLYKVNREQNRAIQDMFIQKDQFIYGNLKYKDQFTTIINNIRQAEMRHLDFSDKDVVSKLQKRIDVLSNHKEALGNVIESIEQNVTNIMADWIQILENMEPDTYKMNHLDIANYHLTAGRANKAREILESVTSSGEVLTKEAFYLLLKCYVQIGLREEYRDLHKQFVNLFGIIYPDFNQLNTFLKAVDDSVFIIQGISSQHGPYSGSGFCIAPNLIVTNRHVIEGTTPANIKIIGKDRIYKADNIELDPINDIAIIKVSDNLKPFRLGEFNFVEPGEQVLAIGFPSPSSNVHSENIYISKGIVNSIRNIDASTERVIFVDAKIGSGMSGSPLINGIGEVVGIITLIKYGIKQNEKGMFAMDDQPVALPVHLVRKYMMKYVSTKIE